MASRQDSIQQRFHECREILWLLPRNTNLDLDSNVAFKLRKGEVGLGSVHEPLDCQPDL
ncbi:MAG TPA: hypothetical protein PL033_11990 [Candidatus Brocadiia bacterium]|nr:hypothetical protein [Candidatus Brocadiia bacterium]